MVSVCLSGYSSLQVRDSRWLWTLVWGAGSPVIAFLLHTPFSALTLKHCTTPRSTLVGWWELKSRYLSVCVFLWKTEVSVTVPCLSIWTSRKAILPSSSLYIVNWMEGFCPFRCWWKLSRRQSLWGQMVKTLSTYPSHILCLCGDISRARASKSSMKMFATMGESDEPIAAPCTCSKKVWPNWK